MKGQEEVIAGHRAQPARSGAVKRAVTMRDIAKATGLSIATVSMVLNKAGRRIPLVTQRLVEEKARELGYFPNLQARSLRSMRTQSIGVLVFDITDPYCAPIIRGIENVLTDFGYMPVLADLQNRPQRVGRCARMLIERRVEGLLAIANPVHLGLEFSDAIRRFHIPGVAVGAREPEGCYGSVVTDNAAGGAAAFEHLYSLGHRKIAVIRGPRALSDSDLRWAGVESAARKKGVRIDPALTPEIQGNNSSYEQGYKLTELLLQNKKRFTGLIAYDDLTAFAAIGALSNAGIKVPEECSVVGFDDISGSAYYNPPLTTICQRLEDLGSIAAKTMRAALTGDLENPLDTIHEKVMPHLMVRKSTAAVR